MAFVDEPIEKKLMIELAATDLDAAGQTLAEKLYTMLAQETTASFEQAVEDFIEADPELDRDLVLPALTFQTFKHLSRLLADSSQGWERVFWGNIAERYDETGEA